MQHYFEYESTNQISKFFENDVLWKNSRVDGYTVEDLVWTLVRPPNFFVVTRDEEENLICVTSCCQLSENSVELHTFILPGLKKLSVEVFKKHLELLKVVGFDHAYTTVSHFNMNVKNFLENRLGFETISFVDCTEQTRDGVPLTLYNLSKVL